MIFKIDLNSQKFISICHFPGKKHRAFERTIPKQQKCMNIDFMASQSSLFPILEEKHKSLEPNGWNRQQNSNY